MKRVSEYFGVDGEARLLYELQKIGDGLTTDFERLAGENGEWVTGFEPGESILVRRGETKTENGLAVDFVAVGMAKKIYRQDKIWGQPKGELMPALRVNRVLVSEPVTIATDLRQVLADYDPYKYRVLFRPTTEGLRFSSVEYLVEDGVFEGGKEWLECDLTTALIVLQALQDLLSRLGQKGE